MLAWCRDAFHREIGLLGLCKRGLIDGELDGISLRTRAQVVHTRLQTFLPGVEVHRGELSSRRLRDVDVERLTLADVSSTIRSLIDDRFLLDLPDRLEQIFDVLGDTSYVLHASFIRDDLIANLCRPHPTLNQLLEQILQWKGR
jgi:hypothetical protein